MICMVCEVYKPMWPPPAWKGGSTSIMSLTEKEFFVQQSDFPLSCAHTVSIILYMFTFIYWTIYNNVHVFVFISPFFEYSKCSCSRVCDTSLLKWSKCIRSKQFKSGPFLKSENFPKEKNKFIHVLQILFPVFYKYIFF